MYTTKFFTYKFTVHRLDRPTDKINTKHKGVLIFSAEVTHETLKLNLKKVRVQLDISFYQYVYQLFPVKEKGDRRLVTNYRPVSLLNIDSKVFIK